MAEQSARTPSQEEIDEESRRVRRLRITVCLALEVIAQGQIPLEEAFDLAAATRRAALHLFPGKEAVYDLIYLPRFRRLIHQVYRIQ